MKPLKIDEKTARKLYPTASKEFKAMLEDTFGIEFFSQNIMDIVKSYEDACEIEGIEPLTIKDFSEKLGEDREAAFNFHKASLIRRVLNEGWKPDWNNSSENKYYPWFDMRGPGSGFSFYDYDFSYARTTVGSRLCFKSSELAIYAGKQFTDIYKKIFTL